MVCPKSMTIAMMIRWSSQPKFRPRYLEYTLSATKMNESTIKIPMIVRHSSCRLSTILCCTGRPESYDAGVQNLIEVWEGELESKSRC